MRRRPVAPPRRRTAAAALAVAIAAALLTSTAGASTPGPDLSDVPALPASPGETGDPGDDPQQALAAAREALGLAGSAQGRGPGQAVGEAREATLALRDLQVALPRLADHERDLGEALLARPTDGDADPVGQGYTSRSKRICGDHVCVHYVTKGADKPSSQAWVRTTLAVMERVWDFETGRLGYRTPVSDRSLPKRENGGNGKFDVYLKELSGQRLYGYCSPEYLVKGNKRLANGYCVLDDDFARSEYGRKPKDTLRVTAAHEFFHAIQFNYDYREDRWLMESTATWVEERFADDVNDNRQYLPVGQVRVPDAPLDVFSTTFGRHYGNWAWWEHLSQRHGNALVAKVWKQAGQFRGAGRDYSTKALTTVLGPKGGFSREYTRFVAANLDTRASYAEGRHWPSPTRAASARLTKDSPTATRRTAVDHMAAKHVDLSPAAALKGRRWRLRLVLDGPGSASRPMAAVTVTTTKGAGTQRILSFDDDGRASTSVPFSASTVESVTVSFVNTSTSFDCHEDKPYSCSGVARHDEKPFRVVAKAFRR